MKCRTAKKLAFEFIDGLEDDTKRLELEQHLVGCSDCERFATQLTRSLDLLHRAPSEATCDNFVWKVRLKINQERNARASSEPYVDIVRTWNRRYAAGAVAAAAVVLAGGLIMLQSGLSPVLYRQQAEPLVTTVDPPSSDGEAGTANADRPEMKRVTDVAVTGPAKSDAVPLPISRIRTEGPHLVDWGSGNRRPSGRIIGVMDRYEPLSVARMDSLVNSQLELLSSTEQIRYLSQSINMLQQHLLKAHINRHTER